MKTYHAAIVGLGQLALPPTSEAYRIFECEDDVYTRWSANSTTYDVTDGDFPEWWENEIKAAANIWNASSGADFRFHHYTGSAHDWTKRPEEWNDRIAEANVYYLNDGTCRVDDVTTWFNTRYNFVQCSDCDGDDYDVRSVAMHEFGHWLVLEDLRRRGLANEDAALVEERSIGLGSPASVSRGRLPERTSRSI